MLCCMLIPTRLICDDNVPEAGNRVGARQTVRELELRIEVMPDSKKIALTIINQSPKMRFCTDPPGLTVFRVKLTDENGRPVKMTAKGNREFNEPSIGSERIAHLKTGVPFTDSIDLAPLFEFPQRGTIRCEVSRLVHFTDPLIRPSERDWITFPPVSIVIGDGVLPQTPKVPAAPSAPVER